MGNPDVAINLSMLMTKELVYKGSFRYGVSIEEHLDAFCSSSLLSRDHILSQSPLSHKVKLI